MWYKRLVNYPVSIAVSNIIIATSTMANQITGYGSFLWISQSALINRIKIVIAQNAILILAPPVFFLLFSRGAVGSTQQHETNRFDKTFEVWP